MSTIKPCFMVALLSFSISCLADSNTADLIQDGSTAMIDSLKQRVISQAAIRPKLPLENRVIQIFFG